MLSWAVQTARGLAAAHQKGIVHRDLKPENVFVTTDGRVKVLDFGLAKLAARTSVDTEGVTESGPTRPGLLMGTVPYMSPEQVQGRPVDARSDIFSLGVVLYELLGRKHPFRRETVGATLTAVLQEEPPPLSSLDASIPRAVDGLVRRCLEKRREERFETARDVALALEAVVAAPAGAAVLEEVEEKSPYPGLSSFTEKDASVFFGREAEAKALWGRIQERKLLAVIGPSGAGKTSFLRAGVVPARPDGWAAVYAVPGSNPALGLARGLMPELGGDMEAIDDLLGGVTELTRTGEGERLVAIAKAWRARHDETLVVVDQFEELFTLNPPEQQARFAKLLGRLATEAGVRVLLSLRDDFLMRCHDHEALAPVFDGLTPLGPLTRDGLRRAVVEPANKRGYRFEDETLVEEMATALEGSRGALPLLAFAVARLWEKRDRERKLLTREAYAEIAGVEGALAKHAEATMDRIGPERQAIVREIFRNLATAQGTRAVADQEELLSAFTDRSAAEEVLRELIDARLLTSYEVEGKEGEPSHHRVEVVHESLLKAWPRLVRWQAQDEEGAVLRDQLRQAAHLWEEKGRTSDLLWTGTAYREFELWRERYAGALTALEEEFARSMADKARRKRRLVRAATAAVVLVSAGVAIAIAVSRHQAVLARQRAETEARRAEAGKLLALGQVEVDRYPTAALAYTTKSLEISDTLDGRLQALRILWKAPPARVLTMPEGVDAAEAAFSRNGHWLATTWFTPPVIGLFGEDGRFIRRLTREGAKGRAAVPFTAFGGDAVFWWAAENDRVLGWTLDGRPFAPFGGPQYWVIGSDEGAYSIGPASKGASGRMLQEWSVSHGVTRLIRSLPLSPGEVPDPTLVRLIRSAGPVLFVRPVPREGAAGPPVLVGRHTADIIYINTPPGAERVLSIDRSGDWCVWSTEDRRLLARRRPPLPHAYSGAVFDPAGSRIGWSSAEGSGIYLWNLDDPPDAELLRLRPGQVGVDMTVPAFHPGGRWMAVSYGYRNVSFWPLGLPHARVLTGHTQGPVYWLRFTRDSRHLVSGARDGLRIWPLRLGEGTQQLVTIGSDYNFCYGVDVNPRADTVAFAAAKAGLFVVDASTRVARRMLLPEPGTYFLHAAFDSTGRRLATAQVQMRT